MSQFPAQVLDWSERGTIEPGKYADLMIYDYDNLRYNFGRYDKVHDLPDGGWRRLAPSVDMRGVFVNGQQIMRNGRPTGATPGMTLP